MGPDIEEKALVDRMHRLEAELAELRTRLLWDRTSEDIAKGELQLLLCFARDDALALRLESVEEVVPIAKLTDLPDAPPWIAGVLDLRGTLVPVLDLEHRLHGAPRRVAADDAIVVCTYDGRPVGLWVAGIPRIHRAPQGSVELLSPELAEGGAVAGVVRGDELRALLLSLPRLFAAVALPEGAA